MKKVVVIGRESEIIGVESITLHSKESGEGL